MSEVSCPESWKVTNLGEIAEWGSGGTPSRKIASYYSGDIPWVKTGDLGPKLLLEASEFITEEGVKNSSAKYFPKNSVAIAMYGATIGKTSILGLDATTNQACAVGIPLEGLTTSAFLYYLLRNEKDNFIAKGKGGAQPNISQTLIKQHEIALPSLAEQKAIAEKLDTLLAQVESTKARLERIPKILKRFRQSVLAAAVSGKLTEEWRKEGGQTSESLMSSLQSLHEGKKGRSNSAAPTKEAHSLEEGDIPCEWRIIDLERCCALGRPITYGILKPGPYVENGVIYLKVRDYPNDKLISDGFMRTSEEIADKYKRSMLKRGDVLLSIRGTVGRVIIIPKHLDGANITQDSARISIDDRVSGDYIKWYLRSPAVQQRMERAKKGVAVKGINIGDVRALQVALPPIEEQTEIVRRVDQLFAYADTIETQVNNALERVNNLTQSILAKAFRGELTEQWRKDNPGLISGEKSAEALLEKIKAEREVAKPKKKAKAKVRKG